MHRPRYASKEEYNQYFREYREKNRERVRAYNREYNRDYRKIHGYMNELNYKHRYPHKEKARRILQQAVRDGTVVRGNCRDCSSVEMIQGHHEDYTKPLEVIWLCPLHHKAIHLS